MSRYGYCEIDSKYFSCYCDWQDEDFLEGFKTTMDDFVIKVCTKLGLDYKNFKFSLEIYMNRNDHKREVGVKEYEDWMEGYCDDQDNKIKVISKNLVKFPNRYEELIKHEIVHAILYHFKLNPPIYINEGLAVWLSGQNTFSNLDVDSCPLFTSLTEKESFSHQHGYDYVGVYTNYLYQKIGHKNFKEILDGKQDVQKYIAKDFEKDAVLWFLNESQANNDKNKTMAM